MILKVLLVLCSSLLVSAGAIEADYSPSTSVSYSSISSPTIVKTISTPLFQKTNNAPINYAKIIQSPTVYESIITTKESKFQSPAGTQHSTYSKSFDTAHSSAKKFESKSSEDLSNSIPGIYASSLKSPIVYHSTPLVDTVIVPTFSRTVVPETYTAHDIPITKAILSPSITSYSTPEVSKTKVISSELSSYSSSSTPSATKLSLPITYTPHYVPLTKTLVPPTVTSYITPVLSKTKYVTSDLPPYSSHTPVIEAQPIKTTLTYSEAPIVSHMSFSGLGANYAW